MELIAYLNPPDDSGPLSFASDIIVSYRVEDAVSDHAPPLGVAAARRYELTLSGGAPLTSALANGARVNVQYKSGAQFLPFGVWYVESLRRDERTGALVLSGCDALGAFGASPFQDSASAYPQSLSRLMQTLCLGARLSLWQEDFLHASLRIARLPDWGAQISLRRALSHCAFLAGGFVRTQWDGSARLVPAFGEGNLQLDAAQLLSYTCDSRVFRFNALSYRHAGQSAYTRYSLDASLPETPLNTLKAEGNPLVTPSLLNALTRALSGGQYEAGSLRFYAAHPPLAGDPVSVTDAQGQVHRLLASRVSILADQNGILCQLESCVPSPHAPLSEGSVFAPDGSVRFEAIGEADSKVMALSRAYIESLSASDINANGLSAKMVEALRLRAGEISARQTETDLLTAALAEIVNASVRRMEAGTITTDELITSLITAFSIKVESVNAAQLSTDRLAAALARFCVLAAGSAEFDRATVTHLISSALNLTYGAAQEVYIDRLAVSYAACLRADLNELRVRAQDGQYYRLLVDAAGQVSAQPTSVSAQEAQNGVTDSGAPIIETSLTAHELSASSVKALYALINKLDAQRIDAAQLFAQNAFIDRLNAQDITANSYLRVALGRLAGDAGSALICAAQNEQRLDEHQAQLEGYARFITVDEDGMKQSKAGSAYATLINESGFHILRRGSAQPVGSFARDGLSAPGLTVGRITARKTARGGWVWEG